MRYIRKTINLILFTIMSFAITKEINYKQDSLQAGVQDEQERTYANPEVYEYLNKDYDIFMWDNVIYSTDIEWVNELILTESVLLGIITEKSTDAQKLSNGMANKLKIGSELYSANERGDVLIVKDSNTIRYYLKLVEG